MKNFLRILCLMLATLVLLGVFASCGPDNNNGNGNGNGEQPTQSGEQYDEYGRLKLTNKNLEAGKNFATADGDAQINILLDDSRKFEMDDDVTNGAVLNNAILNRNSMVEAQLGVEFKVTTVTWNSQGKNTLNAINAACAGAGDDSDSLDICFVHAFYSTGLVQEGKVNNLAALDNLSLDKDWWNQSMNEELTVNGQLYLGVGDAALSSLRDTFCMFYSTALFEDTFGSESDNPVDLYELVDDKEWTMEKLLSLVVEFGTRDNGDDVHDNQDVYGFATSGNANCTDGFFTGLNIKLTSKNPETGRIEFALGSQHDVDAYDATNDLFYSAGTYMKPNGGGGADVRDEVVNMFANNQVLFIADKFSATDVLGTTMEGDAPYGIIPVPMLNADQVNVGYVSTAQESLSALIIPSCVKGDRLDRVSAVLDVMCYESYNSVVPAYFNKILKGRYAPTDEDSRMCDLILNSRAFNFGYIYSFTWGTSNNPLWTWRKQLRTKDVQINTIWSGNTRGWGTAIEDLNDYFFAE